MLCGGRVFEGFSNNSLAGGLVTETRNGHFLQQLHKTRHDKEGLSVNGRKMNKSSQGDPTIPVAPIKTKDNTRP